jgi:hypothetical protein
MSEDVLIRYLQDYLLKMRQIPIYVGDPLEMHATRDKIETLGSQKVGPKNKQLGVIRFVYFIVPYGMGKC